MDKIKLAEKAFTKYAELLPEEANPYDSMAELLTGEARLDEANEYFQKAFSLNSAFTVSQLKYGLNLVYLGDYDEGRAAMEIALQHEQPFVGQIGYLRTIASTYSYEGKNDQAIAALGRARELAEQEGLFFPKLEILQHEAMIYLIDEDLAMLKEKGREIEGLIAASAVEIDELLAAEFERGRVVSEIVIATLEKDYDLAHSQLAHLRDEDNVESSDVYNYVLNSLAGYVEMESGNLAGAIKYLIASKNLSLDLYRLGVAYEALGETAKAKDAYYRHSRHYIHNNVWHSVTLTKSREALARL